MFNNESQSSIERKFQLLGCDDMTFFEPLVDEGTTHIDMYARIMSDTDALVSRYPAGHRQARVVDEAARQLQALGYRITRVDADTSHDEYATYANSTLANGVALVPQYRSSTRNRAALEAYERLGYRAVGIDSRLIIQYGGATHCASMQVPAGN
jgi:agmatine/peptidylarginine deiminase